MLYQRICLSRNLFKYNVGNNIISFNLRNINNLYNGVIKKETILKKNCSFLIPKRNFFHLFKRPTKNQLKIKDNVPDQYLLIYRSTMDRYLLFAQIITTASVIIAVASLIIKGGSINAPTEFTNWKSQPRQTENEIFVYIAVFLTIVAILQVMVSRLPIRIYNLPQQKKYIFVFYGNYPFSQRKAVCTVGDVIQLPEKGILPWKEGRYLIKDLQKVILVDKYFRRPADLYIMLGIQNDPDAEDTK